ncbi:MAG: hypothetical protein HRS57_02770, partial [Mycoplasmataceae bacterium]|nr:hypothetical protein [Mycoplasmataceae bacterium]
YTKEELEYLENDILIVRENIEQFFKKRNNDDKYKGSPKHYTNREWEQYTVFPKLTIGSIAYDNWKTGIIKKFSLEYADLWEQGNKNDFSNFTAKQVEDFYKGSKKSFINKQGRYKFNRFFPNYRKAEWTSDPDYLNLINKSYEGGWTYLNPIHRGKDILEKVYNFDINSSYPASMINNRMPIGYYRKVRAENLTVDKIKKLAYDKRYYMMVEFTVDNFNLKHKDLHPFIRREKSSAFLRTSYSKKTLYMNESMFKMFLDYYDYSNMKIVRALYFKTVDGKYIYGDYIDYWSKVKMNAKDGSFERFFAKLMLNSLYGKNGTKSDRESKILVKDEKGIINYKTVATTLENNSYYKPIASAITGYSRENIIRNAQIVGSSFIYGDTDSMKILNNPNPNIPQDPKKFGYWKNEGVAVRSRYLQNKTYIQELDNGKMKRAIGSLNRKYHHLVNFDNFHYGSVIKDGKLGARIIDGVRVLKPLDFTFKDNSKPNIEIEGLENNGWEDWENVKNNYFN